MKYFNDPLEDWVKSNEGLIKRGIQFLRGISVNFHLVLKLDRSFAEAEEKIKKLQPL